MCVETALSLVTVICDLKRIGHRVAEYIQARLVMELFHTIYPDANPYKMSVAEFSL